MMKPKKGKPRSSEKSEELLLNNCLDVVIYQWGKGFCSSSYFNNLSDDERQQSESIAGFFTDMMFAYLGSVPPQWNEDYMKECCVYLFPEKMSECPEFFQCIAPVLSAFFRTLKSIIFRRMPEQWHVKSKISTSVLWNGRPILTTGEWQNGL